MIYYFKDKIGKLVISSLILYTVKLPSRNLGVIDEVQTLESFRKQGRSRKLLSRAIEKAKKLGLDCLELNVRDDNKIAQDFYLSMGFFDRTNRAYRLKFKEIKKWH